MTDTVNRKPTRRRYANRVAIPDGQPPPVYRSFRPARIREGGDFERIAIPRLMKERGLVGLAAHQSKGPADHMYRSAPYLLVIGARLTHVNGAGEPVGKTPVFDVAERNALWDIAKASTDGFIGVPLIATAHHSVQQNRPYCRCSHREPDPPRFLMLTGKSTKGAPIPWRPFDLAELDGAQPAGPGPSLAHLLDLYRQ